jgi:hypothetical protein
MFNGLTRKKIMDSKILDLYFRKLGETGIPEEACNRIRETYGDVLSIGSFAQKSDSGLAYEGSLLDTSLRRLAMFAFKINELYNERIRADKKSVIKVCLLQHIAKAVRMVKSTDEWRAKKLGEVYSYVNGGPAIGIGMHSLLMASGCGVQFTMEEAEAMTIIDKSDDDMQAKYHSSVLTNVIKQANDMVWVHASEMTKINGQAE